MHEKLAKQFPEARGKAELKIHTVLGITGNTKSIKIYPGKTADIKTMRLGSWVKDNILLFDLSFFKYQMFRKTQSILHRFGAAHPPGQATDLTVKRSMEMLPRLKREVLDALVEVSFNHQSPWVKAANSQGFNGTILH